MDNITKQENRIKWIDSLKGLAIVAVLFTHIDLFTSKPLFSGMLYYVHKGLFFFHVPAFVFISGFLYKNKHSIKKYIINQSCHLMLPYFSLLLLFLPICIIYKENIFVSGSIIKDLLMYYGGYSSFNPITGPLWFLPYLFFTQITYNILQKVFSLNTLHFVVAIIYILSFIQFYYDSSFTSPFRMHLLLNGIPIFHIGYIFKLKDFKLNIFIPLLCYTAACAAIYFIEDNVLNIPISYYGIPVLTIFCSISLIVFFKEIMTYISDSFISGFFSKLGEASLIIMAFHCVYFTIFKGLLFDVPLILIIISLSLSYLTYLIFNRYKWTRALYLGNKNDIHLLFSRKES